MRVWNPVVGCLHDCKYCWLNKLLKDKTPVFKPEEFNVKFPKGSTVFVAPMADAFGSWIPDAFIRKMISFMENQPEVRFLLLTKNPKRYLDFIFPDNAFLGATIETDNDELVRSLTLAPLPSERIKAMQVLRHQKKYVVVEPILPFSSNFAFELIKIKPNWVVIGKNKGEYSLPKPDDSSIRELINILQHAGIEVEIS